MLKKALAKYGGKIFLKDEINSLEQKVYKKRLMQGFVLSSAGLLAAGGLFLSNQPRSLRMAALGISSLCGFGGAFMSKSSEQEELMHRSILDLNYSVHRSETKNRFAKERSLDDINRDVSILRALDSNGLPLLAQMEYAKRFNIPLELFTDRADAMAMLQPKTEESSVSGNQQLNQVLHFSGIASPDKNVVDTILDPKPREMLIKLSQLHPKLIRIDNRWILDLVGPTINPDLGKRFNHHYYISGSSGEGKSVLGSVIARLISIYSEGQSTIAGHDPKKIPGSVDLSDWLCEFTDGYKIDGYENAGKWNELQQNLYKTQMEGFSAQSGVGELVIIQDELNTCYGEGKGYGKDIPPEVAKEMLSKWLFCITNMRSAKGHFIGMGQSPISGDTGIKKNAMQNLCFIALGNTANYILDPKNARNFIYSLKDEDLDILRSAAEFLLEAEVRFALVVPTKGLPYIALTPEFDIEGIKSGKLDQEILEHTTNFVNKENNEEKQDYQETDSKQENKTEEKNNRRVSSKRPQYTNDEPSQESTDESGESGESIKDAFIKLRKWFIGYKSETGSYPSLEAVREVWKRISGQELHDKGLKYIIEKILGSL